MISISGTDAWHSAHPGAAIGLLELSGVEKKLLNPEFNQHKREVETRLRLDFAGCSRRELMMHPVMAAYVQYYKRFTMTYHVLLQVESIIMKGKNLPDVSPLVDANFAAEVNTFVLTAGHDVAKLREPIVIDTAHEAEVMIAMSGSQKEVRKGNMVMRDQLGLCCSILYGQDNRSPITAETEHVLYVSYAPIGVPAETVMDHLIQIKQNVNLFSPNARVEQSRLLQAESR